MKKIIHFIIMPFVLVALSACQKDPSTSNTSIEKEDFGKSIQYKLVDGSIVNLLYKNGEYILGGDIILSPDQLQYLKDNNINGSKGGAPQIKSTFTGEFAKLWPEGKVYYTITNQSKASLILSAINNWQSSTSVQFIQRSNQSNYIDFSGAPDMGAGDSQLGMVGGRQLIRLANSADLTTAIHEIGHALGLMHEQSRADRDDYIDVNYNNINSDWKFQYDKYTLQGRIGFQIGLFDFNSIMLYRSNVAAARVNGDPSPQMTKRIDGSVWGDNYWLSQGDIEGVNYLYTPIYFGQTSTSQVFQSDQFVYEADLSVSLSFRSTWNTTTPIPLTRPVKIRVKLIRSTYGNYQWNNSLQSSYTVDVSAGTSTIPLGIARVRYYENQLGYEPGSYTESYEVERVF